MERVRGRSPGGLRRGRRNAGRRLTVNLTMHALIPMLTTLAALVVAYRFYSAFIAAKVLALDDSRTTPAHALHDGQNYHPTNRWVLFGHHFAAITGAGPLIGPVLAMQFGYFPGLCWIVIGVCLAGAVQDFIILGASVRRNGLSIAEIARREIGPVAGFVAGIAILFIVIIATAGLGNVVVNALSESPWGVFSIGLSIPIALMMGIHIYLFRGGSARGIREATTFGVIAMLAAVVLGKPFAASEAGKYLLLSKPAITYAMACYGFVASVLPVWLLLCPRDYLSSYMKIGTIAILVVGVCIVNPRLEAPAISQFAASGDGPIFPGKLFPFVFITIACGAISGFHSLVASGTTPKMINKESDCRMIGYGAMLMEGLVGVTALVAAASLAPGDYYAINANPKVFEKLGMQTVELQHLSKEIGENFEGRTGGGVSLAVGMAKIFEGIPGMKGLLSYWYHFAIMFEALFILTTIDTGTRVARFAMGEFIGRAIPAFQKPNWLPGSIITSALVVLAWSYFILNQGIDTIWPMFGIANQLLACIALSIGATYIINCGRAKLAWVAIAPMLFVATTTVTAGILKSVDFYEMARASDAATSQKGIINLTLTILMLSCAATILINCAYVWLFAPRRAASAVS
ncbi:MAG: carbon starvation protein A [Planctomycetes bacterium]|nr:carbon starvation protein A [Planctomycetota bacterium]